MKQIVHTPLSVNPHPHNGNGHHAAYVNGRGVKRRKMTRDEAVQLGADIADGVRPYLPTIEESAEIAGVTVAELREERKRRAAWDSAATQTADNRSPKERLVDSFFGASSEERFEAFSEIGVDLVWDVISGIIR